MGWGGNGLYQQSRRGQINTPLLFNGTNDASAVLRSVGCLPVILHPEGKTAAVALLRALCALLRAPGRPEWPSGVTAAWHFIDGTQV